MSISLEAVFITAKIRIKSDIALTDGLNAINAFCLAMNSEAGCFFAYATQSNEDKHTIILWECYRDQAAFDEHFSMEHTQEFIKSGLTELIQADQSQGCFTETLGTMVLRSAV